MTDGVASKILRRVPWRLTNGQGAVKLSAAARHLVPGNPVTPVCAWRQGSANVMRLLDKWAFFFGVLNLLAIEAVMLLRPEAFNLLFLAEMPLLLLIKWLYYRPQKWHLFMFDFCFFMNAILILALLNVIPLGCQLFSAIFTCCMPLGNAIWLWRNGTIFHDVDRLTSLYIHLFPNLMVYSMRHHGEMKLCAGYSLSSFRLGIGLYVLWQIGYGLLMGLVFKRQLARDERLMNSFRHFSRARRNFAHLGVLRVCHALQLVPRNEGFQPKSLLLKCVFVTTQLVFTVASFMLAPCLYNARSVMITFLLMWLGVALFNGASFYIEVFNRKSSTSKLESEHLQKSSIVQACTSRSSTDVNSSASENITDSSECESERACS